MEITIGLIKTPVLRALVISMLLATGVIGRGRENGPAAGSTERDALRESLILHLSFDGNLEPARSAGEPKVQVRGDVRLVEGKQGQAASFTDHASLVLSAEGHFDQSEGTVSLWVRPYWTEKDGTPHCFMEVPLAAALDTGFVVTKGWSDSNHPNLSYFYNSPGDYHLSTYLGYEANEWMHIAFSWSKAKRALRLYRNGQVISSKAKVDMSPRPAAEGRLLSIGARLSRNESLTGTNGADADIDEVMIFNRLLSDAEVAKLAGAAPQAESTPVQKPWDSAHINRVKSGPRTPHLNFNRPSALGTVRALFIVPYLIGARDVVELAQRCDVDFTVVTAADTQNLGWQDNYARNWEGLSTGEKVREAMARLDEAPEVIVVGNVDYVRLPGSLRARIQALVKEGMGLVLVIPRNIVGELVQTPVSDAREQILSGVPLAGMDECFPGRNLSSQELADKVVGAYAYGKGRVVTVRLDAQPPAQRGNCDGWEGLAPGAAGRRWTRQFQHRYNYYLSLAGKAVQWAAGRTARATWVDLPLQGENLQRSQLPSADQSVVVMWSGDDSQSMTLHATVRDPLGRVESESHCRVYVAPGRNTFALALPKLACGRHFMDLTLTSGDQVENWATIAFDVHAPEQITSLHTEREHYERGQTVQGTVQFRDTLPAAAQLVVRAVDTWGRVYSRATASVPAGATDARFRIAVDRPTTLASHIEADLVGDGDVLSRADTVVFVPKRDPMVFVNSIWCGIWNEGIGQVALQQLRKAGFNTVYHWTTSVDFHNDAMADMMPSHYLTRLTLYGDSRGWATHLVRQLARRSRGQLVRQSRSAETVEAHGGRRSGRGPAGAGLLQLRRRELLSR